MGFWENVKKVGKEVLNSALETMEYKLQELSDEKSRELLKKSPNNSYYIKEARRRGLI
ncbi:hypothetical protein [Campylobacter mucosalis]|uniref:Uncharacterized protein n=1 Tax=Campylobacter mucosalis CCUG 21559 TaxID=1032067 RepID=A0A6G5QDY0_9BACT|nr:hypothetical protein [Campylobacter mucosalis]QCD43851.1 hypothetical protein CMUC_0025 [Campylobacter mucosalis CCUG 21559]